MIIQFSLLLVVMIISLIYEFGNQTIQSKKRCVVAVTAVLTLFSGLRTWWYGDLIKYYTLYRNCNGSDWKSYVLEKWSNTGLRIFFRVSGAVGISYDICIFIIAAFIAIALGVVVYKFSVSPYWSYLMFIAMGFYDFTFSGLKQTIAMGFCLLASIYIFESRKLPFLILTGVAFLFHAPAAVFFLAYPIAKKKINKSYFLLIVFTFVLVFVFRNQIVNFLSDAYYADESKFVQRHGIGGRTIMMVLILVFSLFMRKLDHADRIYAQLYNFMVFAAIIQIFSMYNNSFTRLADYYYVFIALFFPLIMETGEHQLSLQPERREDIRFNAQYIYTIAGILISLYSLYYFHSYMSGGLADLYFKFCWEVDAHALYGA